MSTVAIKDKEERKQKIEKICNERRERERQRVAESEKESERESERECENRR